MKGLNKVGLLNILFGILLIDIFIPIKFRIILAASELGLVAFNWYS